MGAVSREARLLYIQMWTLADDHGRIKCTERVMAALLYPFDDDAGALIGGWLDELIREQCVACYVIDGKRYYQILTWKTHQKIDKPTPSRIPEFREDARVTREPLAKPRERVAPDLDLDQDLDLGSRPRPTIKDHSRPASPDNSEQRPDPMQFFRTVYPQRSGSQRWKDAEKAATARIREGHTWQQIFDGAERYARFIEATGKTKTEFVQMASTFLGPNKGFLEAWRLPNTAADTRLESNLDVARAFVRNGGS